MSSATILALIATIAIEFNLPPTFVQAIALVENPTLCYDAINHNENGTNDVGIMQLNSTYFGHIDRLHPETNIREACRLLAWIREQQNVRTYWQVAIVYNAGIGRLNMPPDRTVSYANKVMYLWTELAEGYVNPVIGGK